MAVSDEIIIMGIGLAFSYLVLYRKSKIFGNIAFASIGIALMAFSTGNTHSAIGLLILLGAIVSTIADLVTR